MRIDENILHKQVWRAGMLKKEQSKIKSAYDAGKDCLKLTI